MYEATLPFVANRPDAAASELVEKFAQKLREVRGRNIAVEDDTVRFMGGSFRWVTSWNVLVPITRGEVRIDRDAMLIRYRLTFTQMAVVASLLIAFLLIMGAANGFPAAMLVAWLPVLLLSLVGVNLVIGILRFDAFLRGCLREAGFDAVAGKRAVWRPFRG